ncbi:MAG: Transcriptional regulator, LysR family protein [Myxococcaceae bacterium]|nr:Transcriptional regulator, LysR family protein [Myxococcaceae bacterium]
MSATLPSLDLLVVFCDVVEAGSLTAAAARRAVPKSTVSRSLTRLEDALGARLLERGARRVGLTAEGRSLYAQSSPHLAGLREAAGSVGDRPGELKGVLRFTAPGDFAEASLGELILRFTARHPQLRVEVDLSARMVDLVGEGFDLALRATPKVTDPAMVARELTNGNLQLFASPGYLTRRPAPRTPAELAGHTTVLFRPVDGRSEWVLRGPEREVVRVAAEGRLAGNEFAFIRSALRAGAGVGPLPSFSGAVDVDEGRLVRVLPDWEMPMSPIWLVYPATKHIPRRVKAFRDFLLESFRPVRAR